MADTPRDWIDTTWFAGLAARTSVTSKALVAGLTRGDRFCPGHRTRADGDGSVGLTANGCCAYTVSRGSQQVICARTVWRRLLENMTQLPGHANLGRFVHRNDPLPSLPDDAHSDTKGAWGDEGERQNLIRQLGGDPDYLRRLPLFSTNQELGSNESADIKPRKTCVRIYASFLCENGSSSSTDALSYLRATEGGKTVESHMLSHRLLTQRHRPKQ